MPRSAHSDAPPFDLPAYLERCTATVNAALDR